MNTKGLVRALTVCFLSTVLFTVVSCGGGGNSGSSGPVASPPPPPPPPPPLPPPPAGGLIFTLDDTVFSSTQVSDTGGQIGLDVPGGALFDLTIPGGAFFERSSDVELQAVLDTQGLPDGFSPVAAVRLGPSGSSFGFQPVLGVDLRDLPRPDGVVVVFLANDDGTGLTVLTLDGGDPIADSLGDGPFSVNVPHFSTAVVTVSDPNGPGLPDPDPDSQRTAEEKSTDEVNKIIESEARKDWLGDDEVANLSEATKESLAEWEADLNNRADALKDSATLEEITDIIKESLRRQKALDLVGSDDVPELGQSAATQKALGTLKNQIMMLNQQCTEGASEAPADLIKRMDVVNSLNKYQIIQDVDFSSFIPVDFCLSILVSPESVLDFIPSNHTLTASVVDRESEAVNLDTTIAQIVWDLPGGAAPSTNNPLDFAFDTAGDSLASASFLLETIFEKADVDLFGITSFQGRWSATGNGSANGCEDDEDNGSGSGKGSVTIDVQSIESEEPVVVTIIGSGGDGGETTFTINLSIEPSRPSFGDISGPVTGGGTYRVVENEVDDDGNPIVITTNGQYSINSGSFGNGVFTLSVDGGDDAGCAINGTLTLSR